MGRAINGGAHNKGNGGAMQWLRAHATYQGDDCLIWPFAIDRRVGRGRLGHNGGNFWAHRKMCELAHGPAPTPDHDAAHNCGKGHTGCISPRHLEWKTRQANMLDKRLHGTTQNAWWGNKGKLSAEQKAAIKALKSKQTQVKTAAQFGVSLGCVQYHQGGKERWPSHRRP